MNIGIIKWLMPVATTAVFEWDKNFSVVYYLLFVED